MLLALYDGTLKSTLSVLKSGHLDTVKLNAVITLLERGCDEVNNMEMSLNIAQRLSAAQMSTIKSLRCLLERRSGVAVLKSSMMSTSTTQTGTTTAAAMKSSLLEFAEDIAALVASIENVRFIHIIVKSQLTNILLRQ